MPARLRRPTLLESAEAPPCNRGASEVEWMPRLLLLLRRLLLRHWTSPPSGAARV